MDVFRLDLTTYLPDLLLEEYNSMIWTERYSGKGEFELKTSKIFPMLDVLPEGSLLAIRQSQEVMIVETRSIGVDESGNPELTVVGSSFEGFLSHRVLISDVYNEPWSGQQLYRAFEVAGLMLWTYLVNATGEDPMKPSGSFIDTDLTLPNTCVTWTEGDGSDPVDKWWFESGELSKQFYDILALGDLGFRVIRPSNTEATVVTYDTSSTASRGSPYWQYQSGITQLRFDIYRGRDKTRHQVSMEPVIFHFDSGHINEPSYVFSVKDWKAMALVTSSIGTVEVWPDGGDSSVTGYKRRVLFVDGGDIGDLDYATFYTSLVQKGRAELTNHQRIRLVDGSVSSETPYVFGEDYFLGDRVTLLARYGFEQTMYVSEYIRTEDAEGDREYPGLSSELE